MKAAGSSKPSGVSLDDDLSTCFLQLYQILAAFCGIYLIVDTGLNQLLPLWKTKAFLLTCTLLLWATPARVISFITSCSEVTFQSPTLHFSHGLLFEIRSTLGYKDFSPFRIIGCICCHLLLMAQVGQVLDKFQLFLPPVSVSAFSVFPYKPPEL